MNRPELDRDTVVEVYDRLLSNANDLCRSAEKLLEDEMVALARSLVILALEESGKAIAIHERRCAQWREGVAGPTLDTTFWKEWSDHGVKLCRVHEFLIQEEYWFAVEVPEPHELALGPVEDYLLTLKAWARRDNVDKQRGFYVDVDHQGRIEHPRNAGVSAHEVLQMIELVDRVGWQVRLGDHIQKKAIRQSRIDAKVRARELEEAGGINAWRAREDATQACWAVMTTGEIMEEIRAALEKPATEEENEPLIEPIDELAHIHAVGWEAHDRATFALMDEMHELAETDANTAD